MQASMDSNYVNSQDAAGRLVSDIYLATHPNATAEELMLAYSRGSNTFANTHPYSAQSIDNSAGDRFADFLTLETGILFDSTGGAYSPGRYTLELKPAKTKNQNASGTPTSNSGNPPPSSIVVDTSSLERLPIDADLLAALSAIPDFGPTSERQAVGSDAGSVTLGSRNAAGPGALYQTVPWDQTGAPLISSQNGMPQVIVVGKRPTNDDANSAAFMSLGQQDFLWNSYAGPVTSIKRDPIAQIVHRVLSYLPEAEAASALTGIDPTLLLAIAAKESRGKPEAVAAPNGAHGLMQITERTWDDAVKKNKGAASVYSDYDKYWNDPKASLLIGAIALDVKGQTVNAPESDPSFTTLQLMAYNAGQSTVNAAIGAAKAAGEKDPYAAALNATYLEKAIEKTGIYSYYMPGRSGDSRNSYVDRNGNVTGTPDQVKAEAIHLKYEEISKYPQGVYEWQGKIKKALPGTVF